MIDWSNDDEFSPAGLLSTKGPPLSIGAEDQSRGDKEILEQRAREIPAQQTTKFPVVQTTRVPEQQREVNPERRVERILEHQIEKRSAAEEQERSSQNTRVERTAAPRGSGRHRRFKKLNWQTKL